MPRMVKLIETDSRSVVARGWHERGVSTDFLTDKRFLLGAMKGFWKRMAVMAAQHC